MCSAVSTNHYIAFNYLFHIDMNYMYNELFWCAIVLFVQNSTLVHYSAYSEDHLMPIMQKMALVIKNAPTSKFQVLKILNVTLNFGV